MKKNLSRICFFVVFYAVALLACLAGVGLLSVLITVPNCPMVGLGVWLTFCFGSLCIPDELWERWMADKTEKF